MSATDFSGAGGGGRGGGGRGILLKTLDILTAGVIYTIYIVHILIYLYEYMHY